MSLGHEHSDTIDGPEAVVTCPLNPLRAALIRAQIACSRGLPVDSADAAIVSRVTPESLGIPAWPHSTKEIS